MTVFHWIISYSISEEHIDLKILDLSKSCSHKNFINDLKSLSTLNFFYATVTSHVLQ